jgi:hypothetical protein
VAIDDSGDWWVGSGPADIKEYLAGYTRSEDAYPATAYRAIRCKCGSDRFRFERALSITRRVCAACGDVRYVGRDGSSAGWEEAAEDEAPEPYACVDCGCTEANATVGFAGYPEAPAVRGVKWFYLGVRCAACGILGCFNDGKVGRASKDVFRLVTGELGR